MVDERTIENVLKGLGIPEEVIKSVMPALLGKIPVQEAVGLLDMNRACVYLGDVSRWTVKRAVDSGELPCVSIGTRVFFDPRDLDEFIRSRKTRRRRKPLKTDHRRG